VTQVWPPEDYDDAYWRFGQFEDDEDDEVEDDWGEASAYP
jgi:hypothetical protein